MTEETAKAFATYIKPRTREYIDAKIEDPLRAMSNTLASHEKYSAKVEAEMKERLASMEGRIRNMEQILDLQPKSRAMLKQLIDHFNEDK